MLRYDEIYMEEMKFMQAFSKLHPLYMESREILVKNHTLFLLCSARGGMKEPNCFLGPSIQICICTSAWDEMHEKQRRIMACMCLFKTSLVLHQLLTLPNW